RSGPTTGPPATGPGSSTPARAARPASTTGRSPTPAPATSPATGAPATSCDGRPADDRRAPEHPGPHLLRRPRHQKLRRDRPRVVPLLPVPGPSRRAPLRVRAPLGPPALPRVRDPGGQPMTVYYKSLDPGGRARFGDGTWHLPDGGRPGEWMPEITGLVPCQRGYHVATIDQLVDWLGPELFEVECRGEHIDHGDKHVFGQARLVRRIDAWNDRTARLFAADCAERVLPVFEFCCPGDTRPHRAIEVARAFADG